MSSPIMIRWASDVPPSQGGQYEVSTNNGKSWSNTTREEVERESSRRLVLWG